MIGANRMISCVPSLASENAAELAHDVLDRIRTIHCYWHNEALKVSIRNPGKPGRWIYACHRCMRWPRARLQCPPGTGDLVPVGGSTWETSRGAGGQLARTLGAQH
jgi:hypothetical protein